MRVDETDQSTVLNLCLFSLSPLLLYHPISDSLANQCLLKVASFAAEVEQYDRAIEKFETVAAASMDSQLSKWSLKEYFLKAGFCHLCKGVRSSPHVIKIDALSLDPRSLLLTHSSSLPFLGYCWNARCLGSV